MLTICLALANSRNFKCQPPFLFYNKRSAPCRNLTQKVFSMKGTALFLLALVSFVAAFLQSKHLAGPPQEFPDHVLPRTDIGMITQQSAYLQAKLNQKNLPGGSIWAFELDLPVDSTAYFQFSLFCPVTLQLTLIGLKRNSFSFFFLYKKTLLKKKNKFWKRSFRKQR